MKNDHNQRDSELDVLLAPLKNREVMPGQMAAWKSTVRNAVKSTHSKKCLRWYQIERPAFLQLAFTLVLGFVMGAITVHFSSQSESSVAKTFEPSATIEHIYAKAD
jgi:hypothetical protein